jgi:hypothetical protein
MKHFGTQEDVKMLEFEFFAERMMPPKKPRNVKSYSKGGEIVAAQKLRSVALGKALGSIRIRITLGEHHGTTRINRDHGIALEVQTQTYILY